MRAVGRPPAGRPSAAVARGVTLAASSPAAPAVACAAAVLPALTPGLPGRVLLAWLLLGVTAGYALSGSV